MSVANKRRLAELAHAYRVPVIEDALYAELQYATPLAPAVKAYDRDGWVIVCTSYTKTLAPGFRVGWIEGGRYARRIAELKFSASIAQPAFLGEVLGASRERRLRTAPAPPAARPYAAQVDRLRGVIDRAFPAPARAPPSQAAASCCGSSCRRRATPTRSATRRSSAASPSPPAVCSRRPAAIASICACRPAITSPSATCMHC